MRIESGDSILRSIILEDKLISKRDQVDQEIVNYFQEDYFGEGYLIEPVVDMAKWTRLKLSLIISKACLLVQMWRRPSRSQKLKQRPRPGWL